MSSKGWKTRTKCVVEGCSTRVCSGVSMHGFPKKDKYPDLYQHWVDAVRLNNKTPSWFPLKSNRVCAFHFETVENCRIRVPTVFPNIQQLPSTSEGPNYDNFEDDDDWAEGDEEDPMDAYEDTVAATNLMQHDELSMSYDDTGDTDPTMAYEAIIDEDSAAAYDEIETEYNNIVGDVVSTLTYDNVMDENTEVAYDEFEVNESAMSDQDDLEEGTVQYSNIAEELIYDDAVADDENVPIQTQISPEKLGLSQEDLGDDDYCVVVVKPKTNEGKPAIPEKQEVINVSLTDYRNSLLKTSEKLSNRSRPKKKAKKNWKHVKGSSMKSRKNSLATLQSTDSVATSEDIATASDVQENGDSLETNSERWSVALDRQLSSCEELHPKKQPAIADEEPESQLLAIESQILKSPDGKMEVEAQRTESTETSPTKHKNQNVSPHKDQQNSKPSELNVGNGVIVDNLVLDGEPIKLKDCFVNIAKTPTKSTSKKKTSESKATKITKNDELTLEQDSQKDSDFLNALSLKSSEDSSSGLRRSARIKAGGGKKRKFGARGSWSVAFKESPVKKRRDEIYEECQSPDSIPYDLEDEDDPDVEVTDLEEDDTSEYGSESDVSSLSARKPKPSSNGFGPAKRKTQSSDRAVTGNNRSIRWTGGFCHGRYHKVRWGDQATQVGLPGSCDGFVFDVVRDDPCNVGVSCNIFYHYQPKNWKPLWARTDYVDSPPTSTTINGVRSRYRSQTRVPTDKQADYAKSLKPTAKEHKSSSKSCTNISVSEDTRDLENVESGDVYPGDIVIKVEPAMVPPPGTINQISGLAENSTVDGTSQKLDDINSMAAAALAEVDIKEEEEFHDQAGIPRFDQQSCILTDLCEVSHHGGSVECVNNDAESVARITKVCSLSGSEVAAHSKEPATSVIGIDANDSEHCAEPSSAQSVGTIVDVEEAAIPNDAGPLTGNESSIRESTEYLASHVPLDPGDETAPLPEDKRTNEPVVRIHGTSRRLEDEHSDSHNDPAVASTSCEPGMAAQLASCHNMADAAEMMRSAKDIVDKSTTADSSVQAIQLPNSEVPTENQTKANDSEAKDEPKLTGSDAMAGCCKPKPTYPADGSIMDTGIVKAPMDSGSISTQCPNDNKSCNSSFSSDTDSLVEVPIHSEPDVMEPLMIPVDIRTEGPRKETPRPANPAGTTELRPPSADNTDKNPSADAVELSNPPNSHISNSPAESVGGNSQQVFDNIERNLEKMFEMDR